MVIMKNIVFRFILMSAIFSGCKKDELVGTLENAMPEGKVHLTLHADMGNFTKPVKTRAAVADENNTGDNIWVFILENTNSLDYTLKSIENTTLRENGEVDIVVDQTTNPTTVILLANAPNKYVDNGGVERDFTSANLSHVTSYSELKQVLNTGTLESPARSVPYTPDGVIPMSGEVDFPTGISKSGSVHVLLKRIVAKISVETEIPPSQFQLLGASVCNAPKSGWLLPPRTLWRDNSTNLTNYDYDAIDCQAQPVDSKQTTVDSPIYIYESRSEEQTAVVIKAIYRGNTYFYKLTMTADYAVDGSGNRPKNFYYRNFSYKYIITSVTGSGYSTFQQACDGAPNNNIKSVIDVVDLTSHDIIDNGEYSLGVSNSAYIIYANRERSNLTAVTLSTGGITNLPFIGSITASQGITLESGETFVHPVTEKDIAISIADNFSNGTITIRLGNLTKIIDVSRQSAISFEKQAISTYSTSDYVAGKIESVSDNASGDWIGLSHLANRADLGRREIVNNDGGIHIHLGLNWDKTDGVAGRNAVVYLSRKINAGRVKIYLEQYMF